MKTSITTQTKQLSNSVLYLMSISAGLVVANLYYNQPLLNQIATSYHASKAAVSNVSLATQLGYTLGLLVIVPLGDMLSNTKILKLDFVILIIALLMAAYAPSLGWLIASSVLIGATSAIPQLFVPLAAEFSNPQNQGRATGIVMSGLLIGIIGSRVISGYIGGEFGWRTMYYAGAITMALLAIILHYKLPLHIPNYTGNYKSLIKSLWHYTKTEPALRLAAIRGGLSFAGLSAFWTTLVFLMKDYYGYGSTVTGLFGFLGMIGALGSSFAGKLNDKYSKNKLIIGSIILMGASWLLMFFSSYWLIGIIIGVILVDLGQQTLHITNQNIIFNKNPEARNRVNTVYMVTFFLGGSLGTVLGVTAYVHFGWPGVAGLGLVLTLLIALVHFIYKKKAF